jgi:uncharacterized damage-inducible protein DinB
MSTLSALQTLFAYHWDTASRLLDGASRLSRAELTENPGYGRGSIHEVFFHILRADHAWRIGLQTGSRPAGLEAASFPDLDALRAGFTSERKEWQSFLEVLTEDELQSDISLTDRRGNPLQLPRWRILQHVLLHGMQHHAELAQLLTAKGQSPGDIDFLFYR